MNFKILAVRGECCEMSENKNKRQPLKKSASWIHKNLPPGSIKISLPLVYKKQGEEFEIWTTQFKQYGT